MKRLAFLCSLLAAIYFISCGDNGAGPDDSGPLFEAKVVDTAGTAVVGLRVGSINHSAFLGGLGKNSPAPKACPATEITFSLPKAGHYTLSILNYYGQQVTVFSGAAEAGVLTITWDAHDEDGNPLVSGFYRYVLSIVYNEGGSWSVEKWMVLELGPDPAQTLIGTTNSNGVFVTDDTLLFPCLLGAPPSLGILVEDTLVEVADFYNDTVTITLSDTTQPDKFMYFERPLKVGPNYFEFVWDSTKAY